MGGVIVCDKVGWVVVLKILEFLFYGKSQSSLTDETPGKGIYDN